MKILDINDLACARRYVSRTLFKDGKAPSGVVIHTAVESMTRVW